MGLSLGLRMLGMISHFVLFELMFSNLSDRFTCYKNISHHHAQIACGSEDCSVVLLDSYTCHKNILHPPAKVLFDA